MGALAGWGAVAGAAGATKEHLVRRDEEEIANRKMDIDEARQVRLQKMRDTAQLDRQETGQDFKAGESELDRGQDTSERTSGEDFKAGESERQRQFDAVQLDKKLESAETVADKRAAATAAGKSGSEYKSFKMTETKTDPESGLPMETDRKLTFQPSTGLFFEQKGERLEPFELYESLSTGEKRLYDDPGAAKVFKKKYGKLPGWFKAKYGDE